MVDKEFIDHDKKVKGLIYQKSKYFNLYQKKQNENSHLMARNKYLARQLKSIQDRIGKILQAEKTKW